MVKLFKVALVICIVSMPVLVKAQPPGFDDESEFGVTDVQVPFDGGVGLLVSAAIVVGLKKARDTKKSEKVNK